MQLHKLKLTDFRLFPLKEAQFSPGVNLILGENAIGKTSLLEAIYLLITGRSFRTHHYGEMIRQGASHFHVSLQFHKAGVHQELSYAMSNEQKKALHNGNPLTSASHLLGILNGVLMAPQDVELIKGGPSERRHYLDVMLAQIDPNYVYHLLRYKKALKQRNALLRVKAVGALDAFEDILADAAEYLVKKRLLMVERLKPFLKELYAEISGKEHLAEIQYHGLSHPSKELYLQAFQKMRPRELELGTTLTGPHKDDLIIHLNQKEARYFGSEGEMRSLVSALKLAEWKSIYQESGSEPLLLIDDFGMSLDSRRLSALSSLIKTCPQIIITSANKECESLFVL
jgi:DNA replication and repair protein RecF